MLDVELIVSETDFVRQQLAMRGEYPPLEEVLDLDRRRRTLIHEADELRSARNQVSRDIGNAKAKPSDKTVNEMRGIGDRIKKIEGDLGSVRAQLSELLLTIPNLPMADVPPGTDERSNIVLRTSGEPDEMSDAIEAHWDSGRRLGVIDMESGARMSGSRWYVLSGKGARLQRALCNWMLDVHVNEHGYTEIAPPMMVRRETMIGSGNLPKFSDNLYHDEEDDLWLIPTAEVALNALHSGQIIPSGSLPLRYVAHTACFRREKAAAGRDTRGIKRVHQFEKVEMFRYTEPEQSAVALEEMVAEATVICERLGLVYRVLELCAGERGFQSSKTYDIEVWAAGSREWLEVSSLSNCTDFQTRRNGTRYRPEPDGRAVLPHTLNGSGLALPRVMIAVLENNLNSDGTVSVPPVLYPYTGFERLS